MAVSWLGLAGRLLSVGRSAKQVGSESVVLCHLFAAGTAGLAEPSGVEEASSGDSVSLYTAALP